MNGDRLTAAVALAEVVALQHASDGVPGREPDQPCSIHAPHPAGIELDPRLVGIENLEDLRLVGLGVGLDLLGRKRRTRGVLA